MTRLTKRQLKHMQAHLPHKYSAVRVTHAGYSFASRLEAALFDLLKLREKSGEIWDVKCQPSVYLTDARIQMKPDFVSDSPQGIKYFEAKGYETDAWRIKRRLWTIYGPGPLEVWKGRADSLYMVEEIVPRR